MLSPTPCSPLPPESGSGSDEEDVTTPGIDCRVDPSDGWRGNHVADVPGCCRPHDWDPLRLGLLGGGGSHCHRESARNLVGLSLIAGSAWVLHLFGEGYDTLLASSDPLPLAYFFGWLGSWTGALFLLGVSALILCFPTGSRSDGGV